MKTRFILLMGVAGSGKTTVGKALSARLGWDFYDADEFHPPANIAKMAAGIPLDDHDRLPWLKGLHDLIAACLNENHPTVLACSALKESYRQRLLEGNLGVLIVYLKGDYDAILSRMEHRTGHYMQPGMLQSQFEALEEPAGVLTININLPVGEIVEMIVKKIR